MYMSGEVDSGNTELAGVKFGSTFVIVAVFLFCFVLQIFARCRFRRRHHFNNCSFYSAINVCSNKI